VSVAAEPVAIVGMAGIFPGAPDLGAFWSNLVAGVDAITDVPADRVDPVFFAPGRPGPDRFYCSRGGFIDPTVPFDPSDFGIMPVAASGTEPTSCWPSPPRPGRWPTRATSRACPTPAASGWSSAGAAT